MYGKDLDRKARTLIYHFIISEKTVVKYYVWHLKKKYTLPLLKIGVLRCGIRALV